VKRGYGKAVVVALVLPGRACRVEFLLSSVRLEFYVALSRAAATTGLEDTDSNRRLHDACLA